MGLNLDYCFYKFVRTNYGVLSNYKKLDYNPMS